MTYTAAKVLGLERVDPAVDADCESLAADFVSTMQPPSAPQPPHTGELSL